MREGREGYAAYQTAVVTEDLEGDWEGLSEEGCETGCRGGQEESGRVLDLVGYPPVGVFVGIAGFC